MGRVGRLVFRVRCQVSGFTARVARHKGNHVI